MTKGRQRGERSKENTSENFRLAAGRDKRLSRSKNVPTDTPPDNGIPNGGGKVARNKGGWGTRKIRRKFKTYKKKKAF